jgi:hypothetical protein
MRAVLSEHAVARMGRWGCGLLSQARALEGGLKVARGVMEGMVDAGVEVLLLGHGVWSPDVNVIVGYLAI